MDHSSDATSNTVAGAMAAFGLIGFLFGMAVLVFTIVIYFRIISKAGYSGWWSLVLFVPLLNIVMLIVFAFSTWPIERRNAYLENGMMPPAAPPPMPLI